MEGAAVEHGVDASKQNGGGAGSGDLLVDAEVEATGHERLEGVAEARRRHEVLPNAFIRDRTRACERSDQEALDLFILEVHDGGFASAVSLAAAEVGDPGGERGIMDVDVEDGGVVNVPERGVDVLDLLRERIEIVRVAHGDRLARRDR